jgi:hypothetical protein
MAMRVPRVVASRIVDRRHIAGGALRQLFGEPLGQSLRPGDICALFHGRDLASVVAGIVPDNRAWAAGLIREIDQGAGSSAGGRCWQSPVQYPRLLAGDARRHGQPADAPPADRLRTPRTLSRVGLRLDPEPRAERDRLDRLPPSSPVRADPQIVRIGKRVGLPSADGLPESSVAPPASIARWQCRGSRECPGRAGSVAGASGDPRTPSRTSPTAARARPVRAAGTGSARPPLP